MEEVLETNAADSSVESQAADPQDLVMTSPPPTVLPQELIDKIVDNLYRDFTSLKQCALASSLLKLRSHKHLYSTIRLSSKQRLQRLRRLVNVNSMLLENVHKLELADLWNWRKQDRDLPHILRMATLHSLSILNALCSWSGIHRGTQDALIEIFRSPSLVNLSIDAVFFFPISIFAFDINVTNLALTKITLGGFTDDNLSALSADYSRMTVHTLEIFSSTLSLVDTVLDLPNSFITRIRHLIIYDVGVMASLVSRIMTAARHSLETISMQQMPILFMRNWFPYDFTLLSKLKHIEFYLVLGFGVASDFGLVAPTALAIVVDFFIKNPTAARIQNISIHVICRWEGDSFQDCRTLLNTLAVTSHWAELDRILDAARGSVSSGPKHVVSLDLGLTQQGSQRYLYGPPDDLSWRQSIDQMQIVWHDKFQGVMPLASHRGLLVMGEIVYTDISTDV